MQLLRVGTKIEVEHTNRGDAHFVLKMSGFIPKTYTYCIFSMLSMIVMKVAKLYVLYEHLIIFIHILLH